MQRRWWLAGRVARAGPSRDGTCSATWRWSRRRRSRPSWRPRVSRSSGPADSHADSLSERLALLREANLHASRAQLELGRGPLRVLALCSVPWSRRPAGPGGRRLGEPDHPVEPPGGEVGRAAAAADRPAPTSLQRAADALLSLHAALDDGIREVRSARPLLVGRTERDEFLATAGPASTTARRAGEGLGLAADLWGPAGSTRYFLAFQNPAELRGTGGLIGEYGVLEASPEGPELSRVASYGELDRSSAGYRRHRPAGRGAAAPRRAPDRVVVLHRECPRRPAHRRPDDRARSTSGRPGCGSTGSSPSTRWRWPRSCGRAARSPSATGTWTRTTSSTRRSSRAYVRYARTTRARRRYLQEIARESLVAFRRALALQPVELVQGPRCRRQGRHHPGLLHQPRYPADGHWTSASPAARPRPPRATS